MKNPIKKSMFTTDEDGLFDEAFELNEINQDAVTPLTRVLTLHFTHKRNPEVLERIELASFQSYLIEGLHAGRKTDQLKAYLYGARDEKGETVLPGQMEQAFFGGLYQL